jgi:hypothetical protein
VEASNLCIRTLIFSSSSFITFYASFFFSFYSSFLPLLRFKFLLPFPHFLVFIVHLFSSFSLLFLSLFQLVGFISNLPIELKCLVVVVVVQFG